MKTIKNVIGGLLFAIFINALGYQYLFGDIEYPPNSVTVPIKLPERESLFDLPHVHMDDPELLCMAENIFHEARNQSLEGMQAVGFVTLNRVNHVRFPNSICKVVHEPKQFSWTMLNVSINLNNPIERAAWEQSIKVAYSVINHKVENGLFGVTHYHATYVNPQWGKVQVVQIDDHVFFTTKL